MLSWLGQQRCCPGWGSKDAVLQRTTRTTGLIPSHRTPGRYDAPLQSLPKEIRAEQNGELFSDYTRNSTAHRRDPGPSVNQQQVHIMRQQQQRQFQANQNWGKPSHKYVWKKKTMGPSSQQQSQQGRLQSTIPSKQQPRPADAYELVRYVHYPRFLVDLQEELFKIHPDHVKDLNLHTLF